MGSTCALSVDQSEIHKAISMIQMGETVFSKSIIIKTREIYPLSLDILDNMAAFGVIKEKRHEFETSGPRKRVHLSFDMEDIIDEHSAIIFSFMINGDSNGEGFLDVGVKGSFYTRLTQTDKFGSETFNRFYFKSMFPMLRKGMGRKIDKMGRFIEKKIEGLNFKYA